MISNHENTRAYLLISADDKKLVSKGDFGRSPWPFLNQDIFYQYINLFRMEIVESEIKDEKAYVNYKLIGPIKLFMQAWDKQSEEDQKNILNGANIVSASPTEFRKRLEERIKKSIANNNFSIDAKIRTVELIKENKGWKLHLNLRNLKKLQETIKTISRVDTKLGYSKYGEINLDDHNPDEKRRIYRDSLNNYMRAKEIIGSLNFVSEDDISSKKRFMRIVQDKVDKLKKKMSEESAKQK
jgi:hypothetical protein